MTTTTTTQQAPAEQSQQQSATPFPSIGGVDARDPVKMAEALSKQIEYSNTLQSQLGKYKEQEAAKKAARGAEIANHLSNIMDVIGKNFNNVDGKLLPKEKAEQFGKFLAENQDLTNLESVSAAYEVIAKASSEFADAVGEYSTIKDLYEKEKALNQDLQTQLKLYQVSSAASAPARFQAPSVVVTPPAPVVEEKKRHIDIDLKGFKRVQREEPPKPPADLAKVNLTPEIMDTLLGSLEARRAQLAQENNERAIRAALSGGVPQQQQQQEVSSSASADAKLTESNFDFYLSKDHAATMMKQRQQQMMMMK